MQRMPQRRFHVISLTLGLLAAAVTAASAADISCLACHEKENALYA